MFLILPDRLQGNTEARVADLPDRRQRKQQCGRGWLSSQTETGGRESTKCMKVADLPDQCQFSQALSNSWLGPRTCLVYLNGFPHNASTQTKIAIIKSAQTLLQHTARTMEYTIFEYTYSEGPETWMSNRTHVKFAAKDGTCYCTLNQAPGVLSKIQDMSIIHSLDRNNREMQQVRGIDPSTRVRL